MSLILPVTGISRLERWERAKKLGLNPPEEIKVILERHTDPEYTERFAVIDDSPSPSPSSPLSLSHCSVVLYSLSLSLSLPLQSLEQASVWHQVATFYS